MPSKNEPRTPFDGLPGAIEASEARGQRELVESDTIPTEGSERLAALGFVLGEPLKDDPLFRSAKLPEGWSKEPSPEAMWSYIVDERGFRRVAVFYKAAFYDRRADVQLLNLPATAAQEKAANLFSREHGFPDGEIERSKDGDTFVIVARLYAKDEKGEKIREEIDGRVRWKRSGETKTLRIDPDGTEEKS